MSATALRAPDRPATPAPRGVPAKAALGAGLLAVLALVVGVGIIAALFGQNPSPCQAPATGAATSIPAPGTASRPLRGKVSWFGGPNDRTTSATTASGLPVTRPGIAVFNTQTLRGFWWVRFPNGRAAVLQQTDVGPAPWTGRVLDVLYSALPRLGYSERSFPTDAQIEARYLGKDRKYAAMAGALAADELPAGAAPDDSGGCGSGRLDASGVPGKVTIAPGANRPGMPMQPPTLRFIAQMAGLYGKPITVTTGTNHSQYSASGLVSDHWNGFAGDIGMAANGGTTDGPVGDRIMTACLVAAGVPEGRAAQQARAGGLYTLTNDGLRIQCIWKTDEGGNHHNHVHAAARPAR